MKLLLDMVHHNPGEAPFQSQFLDPARLAGLGYNGQVLKHANCVATFDALGLDLFPAGSPQRAWLDPFTSAFEQNLRAAKACGLAVFSHIDLFVLPARLVEQCRDRLCDAHGRIAVEQDFTWTVHQILFEELFARYPELDGFIVRHGETYLYDTPFHIGNGPVPLHGPFADPAREHGRFVQLIQFLRAEICVRHGRRLIFRTWDFLPDKFHADADYYRVVTDMIEPHLLLTFSIKHTTLDFYRRVKVNEALGQGRHPQLVEVQCQREYEGKGAYPNYVMDGVINGFEENAHRVGLSQLVGNPRIHGLFTWSRGGGWYGPYITEEFWCALNVGVIARWARDPSRSEEVAFMEYCREELRLDERNARALRRVALLSARAVLKGRYCEAWDRTLAEVQTPTALWMRDDRLGGLEQLGEVFAHLHRHQLVETALREKAESVALWEELVAVMESIHFADASLHERLLNSARYGLRLFRLVEAGWRVMARGAEAGDAITDYDRARNDYCALAGAKGAASLYRGDYFALPGAPPVGGLDETVERFRTGTCWSCRRCADGNTVPLRECNSSGAGAEVHDPRNVIAMASPRR